MRRSRDRIRARVCRVLLIGLLCPAFGGPALADLRVALVVGNSAYKNVTPLPNPKNDARLMAETLRGLGFKLVGNAAQLDLDKAGFDVAVQDFGKLLQGADVGLFYYAGHGVQVRGANYLVPVGANPTREADVDFQMLDTNLVLRQMESTGTRLNLVILDACRNNPFGGRGLRATAGGLAQMRAPEGTLISFATQPGNVAQDGTGGNSPYTAALAQTIRRPGLGIFDVFNEVGLAVMQATGDAQQPWLSSSPIRGSFNFAAAPAAVTAPAPASPSSEAERAWAAARDTRSPGVLEAFIRRYENSFYADLARARIEELKADLAKAALPPPGPEIATDPVPGDARPSGRRTATGRPILEFGAGEPQPAVEPEPAGDARPSGRRTATGRPILEFGAGEPQPMAEPEPAGDARPSGRVTATGRPILEFGPGTPEPPGRK